MTMVITMMKIISDDDNDDGDGDYNDKDDNARNDLGAEFSPLLSVL